MYIVRKRIKNRYYLYEQETYRVGKKVKTRNRYIGPAGSRAAFGGAPIEPRSSDAIHRDLDEATTLRDILKDTLLNHRCKPFLKYRGRGDNSFAELNATALIKGTKAKYLDTLLSESGYADFDELDASVEEYFAMKKQYRSAQDRLNKFRKERAEAVAYHRAIGWGGARESIVKEVKDATPAARVDTPRPTRSKPRPYQSPHLRRSGNRIVYVSDRRPIKRAAAKQPYADKRRAWRKVFNEARRKLPARLGRDHRSYKNRWRSTRYIDQTRRTLKILKKPGQYFNRLVPDVGQARTADRYVEKTQAAETTAATGAAKGTDNSGNAE